MLLGILIDAYRFFDRRWLQIIMAALICAGITEAIVTSADHFMKSALIVLKDINNENVPVSYGDVVEPLLLALFKVWFDTFLVLLLKNEIEKTQAKTLSTVLNSFKIYTKILLYYFVSQLLIIPSLAATFLATASDPTGLTSLIPLVSALILLVWFSLIIPVVILEPNTGIIGALGRSRYLVSKHFLVVSVIILLGSLPPIAMLDVASNSPYAQAIELFLTFASMIIESLTIMFAYIHLRIAKGEVALAGNVSSQANTSSPAQEERESFGETGEGEALKDGVEKLDGAVLTDNEYNVGKVESAVPTDNSKEDGRTLENGKEKVGSKTSEESNQE